MLVPRLKTANMAQIPKASNAIGRKRQGHQLRGFTQVGIAPITARYRYTFKMADISKDALRKEITGK